MKTYLHVCYHACECVCVKLVRALTGGRCVKGPFPQPVVLSSNQQRNPLRHVSFPPVHASPPGALTAAAARRGPLVKPCCHTPWHLPPYLHSKCQNHRRWMFDFYLFMWCFFSPPPTPRSWITFKIYCMSKTQSRLPVYGSCQEAVMLVCSAQHTHRLMNSWAWRWKNFCKCLRVFLYICLSVILHLNVGGTALMA